MNKVIREEILFKISCRSMREITLLIKELLPQSKIEVGLCHIFNTHTSASLTADSAVRNDLESFVRILMPDDESSYSHKYECADDMPSHNRSIITDTSLAIPIRQGKLALGRWQGIFSWKHTIFADDRRLLVTLWGI